MVRSMYSGVSGLRSHQTRMDTIGNNIANVNTYGFKSGRTTFRDIYYQSMRSASEPTAAVGGMNPSSVGYGAQVGSVDLMMGRSTFSMTDQTMDMAIDGDGFFQVQDAAGNTYYTRAGMLGFDAAGNLVDMQGNFVLGVNGDPTGQGPSSDRIQVVLPPVPPTAASVVQEVNGLEFTISTQNPTTDGNLNLNFATNPNLADGEVVASISTTGIIITMHPDNVYDNLGDLNTAINDAITRANNGPHPAGTFTVSYTGPAADNPFLAGNMPAGGYKASELVSVDYSPTLGKIGFSTSDTIFGGVYPTGKVGTTFGASFSADDLPITSFAGAYNATDEEFTFTMVIDGKNYVGTVDSSKSGSGKFMLKYNNSDTDYIEMARPSFNTILDAYKAEQGDPPTTGAFDTVMGVDLGDGTTAPTVTTSKESNALGFSSTSFPLRGGTAGGPQTVADMTNIYIAPNGIISGKDAQGLDVVIGRIDVVTFANPAGLNQAGSSNYTESSNSGEPILNIPGENGAGKLVSGTLELSNVDLSREFSDMITTQRGYQANSRIITVSDTMLEELINLKR